MASTQRMAVVPDIDARRNKWRPSEKAQLPIVVPTPAHRCFTLRKIFPWPFFTLTPIKAELSTSVSIGSRARKSLKLLILFTICFGFLFEDVYCSAQKKMLSKFAFSNAVDVNDVLATI